VLRSGIDNREKRGGIAFCVNTLCYWSRSEWRGIGRGKEKTVIPTCWYKWKRAHAQLAI